MGVTLIRRQDRRAIVRLASRAVAALGLACAIACGGNRAPTAPPTAPPTPAPAEATCGVERWAVKTLSDADAPRVAFAPITTTVAALAALPPHCGGGPDTSRAYPEEFQVFEVIGRIIVVRSEDDHDMHIALADPNDSSATMVTEVADPGCAESTASPMARQLLNDGRASFEAFRAGRSLGALVGELVRVRGVGFFDFAHGQTGRSASCIELHPILSIERSSP